jgi:hypothetical protein
MIFKQNILFTVQRHDKRNRQTFKKVRSATLKKSSLKKVMFDRLNDRIRTFSRIRIINSELVKDPAPGLGTLFSDLEPEPGAGAELYYCSGSSQKFRLLAAPDPTTLP